MINEKEKIQIERDFISLLLSNKAMVSNWIEKGPKIEFFEDVHTAILHAVTYAYNQDVLLTKLSFLDYLKRNKFKKLDIQSNEHLFDILSISLVKEDDFPNLRDKISESYVGSKSVSFMEQYQNNVKNGGEIFASEKLKDQIDSLLRFSTTEKPIVYESISDYSSKFIEELMVKKDSPDKDSVKCHIKEIDDTMVVGFFPGTLTLFCADVGGYKSTMMLNVAINVWKNSKKNVLFVPLEMPKDKLYQKLLSRESGIPFDKMERPEKLDEKEWEKLRATSKEWDSWDHKFYIMDAPERVPVSVIKRAIEENINIFKPDLIVVDYIANLVAEKGSKVESDTLLIGKMLKDLRHMGKKNSVHSNGFAIISGAQIGREALKRIRKSTNTTFYSEDLRGSHEYSADADNIYAQMPDPQQPDKKLHLYIIKSRYGRKTFLNGSSKAVLDVRPEISLIKSIDESFFQNNQKNILSKIDDSVLNFEDMINDSSSEEVGNSEAAEMLEGKSSSESGNEFDNDILSF